MTFRWSDDDRKFGPFIYARDGAYRSFAIMLSSGDDDDYPGCRLRFSGFGRTLIAAIPRIISPWSQWVPTRSAVGGYYDTHTREYGFSLSRTGMVGGSSSLHVHYGPQTGDSRTTKSKCYFLPWTQWRHVRHSLYDASGELHCTIPEKMRWSDCRDMVDSCQVLTFRFNDFDGEVLHATTRIEEREWRFGEGWFKWLSWFRKPMISRYLDIQFSGETGREKGSWKGGTVGHSIEMLPGEMHEAAFRRYCAQHEMTVR